MISLCDCCSSDKWEQAEILMTNYKNVLERREELNSEVEFVEQENEKLERELQSMLKDKINEELEFPPSRIVSMDVTKNAGVK